MRRVEAEAAEAVQRLDDRAKEEKLKQVAAIEQAYQVKQQRQRAQVTKGGGGAWRGGRGQGQERGGSGSSRPAGVHVI